MKRPLLERAVNGALYSRAVEIFKATNPIGRYLYNAAQLNCSAGGRLFHKPWPLLSYLVNSPRRRSPITGEIAVCEIFNVSDA